MKQREEPKTTRQLVDVSTHVPVRYSEGIGKEVKRNVGHLVDVRKEGKSTSGKHSHRQVKL